MRDLVASDNYLVGQTVSNAAIVPVSADGTVCFFSMVPTDIVVDINGWLTSGGGFTAVAPKRVFDTRPGESPDAMRTVQKTPVTGGSFVTVDVTDIAGAPATGAGAVSLNVGVTNSATGGIITVHPCGVRAPTPVAGTHPVRSVIGFVTVYPCGSLSLVASVNYTAGQTVANAVLVPVSGTALATCSRLATPGQHAAQSIE